MDGIRLAPLNPAYNFPWKVLYAFHVCINTYDKDGTEQIYVL
jgi:hypothetical protein